MLHFFSVPPSSKRQAAGPLTENLPNVCLLNELPGELPVLTGGLYCTAAKASREQSLHQGTISRLSSREVCSNAQRIIERELRNGFPCAAIAARRARESKGISC